MQRKPESPLQNPSRLNAKIAGLTGFVESADAAPTRQQHEVFDNLSAKIDAQLARLREVVEGEVAAFNAAVSAAHSPRLPSRRPWKGNLTRLIHEGIRLA